MTQHREIYKTDTKGKTRVWSQQSEGPRYRTVAGIKDGNLVESGWTVCVGKQGRTDDEQCQFEVEAAYQHKLTREYHENIDDIGQGAHFYKPMLAQKYYEGWPGPCYAQPKLDGIRCIATKDGLFSRQGKPITAVPHIHAALSPIFEADPDIIIDGELYNHELKADFGEISSIVRKQNPTAEDLEKAKSLMEYHVYDLPSHPGRFSERAKYLADLHNEEIDAISWIRLVPTHEVTSEAKLDELYSEFVEQGYEGQMVRLNQPYEQKRSKSLLKRKEFRDDEFEVVSIEEGLGNWAGVAKRVVCKLPDGRTFGAGIKGTHEHAADLLHEVHKVVTIKFFEYTPDGVPRFPVATQFHGPERTL